MGKRQKKISFYLRQRKNIIAVNICDSASIWLYLISILKTDTLVGWWYHTYNVHMKIDFLNEAPDKSQANGFLFKYMRMDSILEPVQICMFDSIIHCLNLTKYATWTYSFLQEKLSHHFSLRFSCTLEIIWFSSVLRYWIFMVLWFFQNQMSSINTQEPLIMRFFYLWSTNVQMMMMKRMMHSIDK